MKENQIPAEDQGEFESENDSLESLLQKLVLNIAGANSINLQGIDLPNFVCSANVHSHYDPLKNTIYIHKTKDFNPEEIGEEIGHFFRFKIAKKEFIDKPEKRSLREIMIDEFFGFIGRRLLYRRDPSMFPEGEPYISKENIMKKIRGFRERYLARFPDKTDRKAAQDAFHQRKSLLGHLRGYQFGSTLDISRIKKMNEFFQLPDSEIRNRFFTGNPDYSGLDDAVE